MKATKASSEKLAMVSEDNGGMVVPHENVIALRVDFAALSA